MQEADSTVFENPRILGRDQGVFAVYKPSGWVVHMTGEGDAPPLVEWLVEHGEGAMPVHRLDRSTSGVVLCSPDPAVRARLSQWFAERLIEKRYVALVHGETKQKGVIRAPLQDSRRGRKVESITRYRCQEILAGCSLLELHPETGRKHQLRRHLQGLGHPIVGDRRYGASQFQSIPGSPNRLWLHAQDIRLPIGLSFHAPLPEELVHHRDQMRARIPVD